MVKIAVLGASGRMGRAILACLEEQDDVRLSGALTDSADAALGRDAGESAGLGPLGVLLTDDRKQALHGAQVAVDFTLPRALEANVKAAVDGATPLVVGTTGLEARHMRTIEAASREIPLLYARNMSVGMNVFMELVARAAAALTADYDAEITEAHHRHKIDAPSGTALALGERIAAARGHTLEELAVRSRDGTTGPRVPETIGFSVIRGGSIVGDHSVHFIAGEEQLEFKHRAVDRAAFARGAVRAALWAAGRAPGYYSMRNVLGLARD